MAAKTFPNTKTNTTNLQTPARRILGELFPNKSKNGDRSVASPVIELADPYARVRRFRETPEEELARDRRALKRIGIGALAAGGVAATIIHKGRVAKPVVAAVVPAPRTWPKLIHTPKPKVARVKKAYPPSGFWTKAGRKARTALEVRYETPARRIIDFGDSPTPRDRLSRARDAAIIGGAGAVGAGALAVGGGALYAGRRAGGALKQVRETVTPEAVARAGMKLVKRKAKQKAVEYFPTFSKWGGEVGRALGKNLEESRVQSPDTRHFSTPASSLVSGFLPLASTSARRISTPARRLGIFSSLDSGLPSAMPVRAAPGFSEFANAHTTFLPLDSSAQRIDFGTAEQLKTRDTKRYAGPLRVAAGVEEGYRAGSKDPVDLPIGDMQVIKAAYRQAGDINKWGGRGVKVVRDASDVVRGVPRQRDTSGRKKKREWEKSWAQEHARKALIGAGILGYTVGMKRSPRFRDWNIRAAKAVKDTVNDYVPNTFESIEENSNRQGAKDAKGREERVFLLEEKRGGPRTTDNRQLFSTPAQRMGIQFLAAARPLRKASGPEGPTPRRGGREDAGVRKEDAGGDTRAPVFAGMRGGIVGGVAGGYWGAAGAASSKSADDYYRARNKHNERRVKEVLKNQGRGNIPGKAPPFSKPRIRASGNPSRGPAFGWREKFARAEHEALVRLKKTAGARALGGGLAGAALLGGASYAAALVGRKAERGKQKVEMEKKKFTTPGSRVISFDSTAADAGWDVRDPRGRSARVFAPGSRKRVRREKSWAEEVSNERALWKAGIAGAGLAAGAAGIAVGRRWPQGPIGAASVKLPVPVMRGGGLKDGGLLMKIVKRKRKI